MLAFPVGVERAPLPDAVPWHEQADRPVDRPPVAGDLGVGVLGLNLIAEEARRLAAACVIRVLDGDSSRRSSSRRNAATFALISSASCLGPANPSSQSSA